MREMVRPTSAAVINSRSVPGVPKVTLTSFSASRDGSLKDVELRGSLAPANRVTAGDTAGYTGEGIDPTVTTYTLLSAASAT